MNYQVKISTQYSLVLFFPRVYTQVSKNEQLIEIINISENKLKILDTQDYNMIIDATYHKLFS